VGGEGGARRGEEKREQRDEERGAPEEMRGKVGGEEEREATDKGLDIARKNKICVYNQTYPGTTTFRATWGQKNQGSSGKKNRLTV